MICTHGYPLRERWCDTRAVSRQANRERQGYIGGIAYALRLLNTPGVEGAAKYVLDNLLDGHADYYVSMADSEMKSRVARLTATAAAQPTGDDDAGKVGE